jgi:hypothetical protein
MLDDDSVIGGPAQLTSQAEISEPKFGFGLAVTLGEVIGGQNRIGSWVL